MSHVLPELELRQPKFLNINSVTPFRNNSEREDPVPGVSERHYVFRNTLVNAAMAVPTPVVSKKSGRYLVELKG